MDILLQCLDIRKQKQTFIEILDVPSITVHQSICPRFGVDMFDKVLDFIDCVEHTYRTNLLLVGVIDAKYCNRAVLATYSYADFCQLASGLGEASSTD